MARLFIPSTDENFVQTFKTKGLGVPGARHWVIARIALARSLQLTSFPDEELKKPLAKERGLEIHMGALTGENSTNPESEDFTDTYRLLLGMYHKEDLFGNPERFIELLQRHILRGINELRASWKDPNDLYDYLYQEMFFEWSSDGAPQGKLVGKLLSALGEIGVNATIDNVVVGPRLTRYKLHLASSGDLDRLKGDIDKVPFELGIKHDVSLVKSSGQRRVALDIPRPERDWHPISSETVLNAGRGVSGALPVCVGTDTLGKPYVFDLAETPHLFIGGTTGSGKSVCIHALLLSLLDSGKDIQLVLIDPKEVEFQVYSSCKNLWGKGIITEVAEASKVLQNLIAEMDRRQGELARLGVQNIAEAQEKGREMPRIIAIVDELADLIMQDPDIEDYLVRLSQKARATGIHLVLATQRPDAKTFSGKLRTNMMSRIALTVRTGQESRIILDEQGAEKLLGRGDMILRLGTGEGVRLHGARVEQGDIRAIL